MHKMDPTNTHKSPTTTSHSVQYSWYHSLLRPNAMQHVFQLPSRATFTRPTKYPLWSKARRYLGKRACIPRKTPHRTHGAFLPENQLWEGLGLCNRSNFCGLKTYSWPSGLSDNWLKLIWCPWIHKYIFISIGCINFKGKGKRKSHKVSAHCKLLLPLRILVGWHLQFRNLHVDLLSRRHVSLCQGCQMAKFDPFLSLDCARVEGVGTQSKERKGSNFAAQRSGARVRKPEGQTIQ